MATIETPEPSETTSVRPLPLLAPATLEELNDLASDSLGKNFAGPHAAGCGCGCGCGCGGCGAGAYCIDGTGCMNY